MAQTKSKEWKQPELTVLGDVETLTLKTKAFGTSDGYIFISGQGLQNISG